MCRYGLCTYVAVVYYVFIPPCLLRYKLEGVGAMHMCYVATCLWQLTRDK